MKRPWLVLTGALAAVIALPVMAHAQETAPFHLMEATISDIHNAIKTKQITCAGLVQAYINRAAAYNGVCTKLVTADGTPIPLARGVARVGSPLAFPTDTVPVSSVLPNFNQYVGLPIDLGRMEATISDPSVQQQYGLRVGIPNAGQVNALETLNIRGKRSVTCKGAYDAHPSTGPLPNGAPPDCEAFRRQPDALERAAELDAQYGSNPPLEELPMYCAPVSIKNWYDAKDMRATGGNDVNFAMDAPRRDSTVVARLRAKGAIVYAIANAAQVSLSGSGPAKATKSFPSSAHEFAAWGGQPCNPYDTEREPRGSSSGSAVSVAANLVVCSICEQGFASCKSPASRNNIVNFLATKGVMMDGGIHSQKIHERAGIHCRTVGDAARVLDAVKGYNPEDYFSAIPKTLIPDKAYASFVIDKKEVTGKPLAGMRIGVVREFMLKHSKNDVAISDHIDNEIKTVLRDKLGAELVESVDPLYPDDPAVPNMKYTFQDAFAEILAFNVPEYFFQTKGGALEFAVPGFDVRTMDYMIKLALGKAPLSAELNLRRIAVGLDNAGGRQFTFGKYLLERGDKRITDWASFVANSKWKNDEVRASAENAVGVKDLRATSGIDRIKMHTVIRLVIHKVMYENNIDAFVNPENTLPPRKLFGASEPIVSWRDPQSCCGTFTPFLGIPEIDVPAGFNQIVYEPQFVLSADKKSYREVSGSVKSLLPHPMPVSMMFWAGAGGEPALFKVASAYEAATKHRVAPRDFGPVSGEP